MISYHCTARGKRRGPSPMISVLQGPASTSNSSNGSRRPPTPNRENRSRTRPSKGARQSSLRKLSRRTTAAPSETRGANRDSLNISTATQGTRTRVPPPHSPTSASTLTRCKLRLIQRTGTWKRHRPARPCRQRLTGSFDRPQSPRLYPRSLSPCLPRRLCTQSLPDVRDPDRPAPARSRQ